MLSRKKTPQMLLVLDHTSTLSHTKERPWNMEKPTSGHFKTTFEGFMNQATVTRITWSCIGLARYLCQFIPPWLVLPDGTRLSSIFRTNH